MTGLILALRTVKKLAFSGGGKRRDPKSCSSKIRVETVGGIDKYLNLRNESS